eukprot:440407-Alexandrium_andersonii.AAC.1
MDNVSAVATSESKCALLRVNSRPGPDLEAFFYRHDPAGTYVDEDCQNYLRAAAPFIRAAIIYV